MGVSDLEHPEKALTSFNAMVYNVGASSVKNYYGTHFPASELRAWTENATWRTPEVEVDVLTPTVYNVKVHTAAEDFVLDARWSQCSYCARQTENFKPLMVLDCASSSFSLRCRFFRLIFWWHQGNRTCRALAWQAR